MINASAEIIQNTKSDKVNLITSWIEALENSVEKIRIIKLQSEEEVVGIGASLQSFHSLSKEISICAFSTISTMIGDVIEGNIKELNKIITYINTYLAKSGEEISHSKTILNNTYGLLSDASDGLQDFNRIVKHLRVLGVSTKIENSRLNIENTGFGVLAENVENLSNIISDKANITRSKALSLNENISRVISKIIELQNVQNRSTKEIVDNINISLQALTANYELCFEKAKIISKQSEILTHSIHEIVTSVQFFDIVRQQMEHVEEAFNALHNHLSSGNVIEISGDEIDESLLHSCNVCRIQIAQLYNSRDEFYNAVQNIIRRMNSIQSSISGIFNEVRSTRVLIDNNGDLSFNQIRKDIAGVTASLNKNSSISDELSASVISVVNTVKDLSGFIFEVEEIGTEIEMIAINAQIKAAHTGKEGVALGVIAESIQKLSFITKEQTTGVSCLFEKIVSLVSNLSTHIEINNNSRIINTAAELNSLANTLDNLKENLIHMTQKIQTMVEQLLKDIIYQSGKIEIHNKLSSDINNINEELSFLLEETGKQNIIVTSKNLEKLHELEKNYTMHSERKIHENLISVPKVKENPIVTENKDDYLGDNIELF